MNTHTYTFHIHASYVVRIQAESRNDAAEIFDGKTVAHWIGDRGGLIQLEVPLVTREDGQEFDDSDFSDDDDNIIVPDEVSLPYGDFSVPSPIELLKAKKDE